MTGRVELAPGVGVSSPVLGPVPGWILRRGRRLTSSNFPQVTTGAGRGANPVVRKLTRGRRPNPSPRTTGWSR